MGFSCSSVHLHNDEKPKQDHQGSGEVGIDNMPCAISGTGKQPQGLLKTKYKPVVTAQRQISFRSKQTYLLGITTSAIWDKS